MDTHHPSSEGTLAAASLPRSRPSVVDRSGDPVHRRLLWSVAVDLVNSCSWCYDHRGACDDRRNVHLRTHLSVVQHPDDHGARASRGGTFSQLGRHHQRRLPRSCGATSRTAGARPPEPSHCRCHLLPSYRHGSLLPSSVLDALHPVHATGRRSHSCRPQGDSPRREQCLNDWASTQGLPAPGHHEARNRIVERTGCGAVGSSDVRPTPIRAPPHQGERLFRHARASLLDLQRVECCRLRAGLGWRPAVRK